MLSDLKGLEIGRLHMDPMKDAAGQELAYIPGSPEEYPLFYCPKSELQQRLADAIEQLPERERLVLTLYDFEELTMKEVSVALGLAESRVSKIYSVAVLRLRIALASHRHEGSQARMATTPRAHSAVSNELLASPLMTDLEIANAEDLPLQELRENAVQVAGVTICFPAPQSVSWLA